LKVFYTQAQVFDLSLQGPLKSPSSLKPMQMAEALSPLKNIEFVEPKKVTVEDLKLCHSPEYVDDVLNCRTENGFGTKFKDVNRTLWFTNGAMYSAALAATPESPTCALVSGFHHAGYAGWKKFGCFCTFNGLMVTAMKFMNNGKRVAIIDADMHWGNGTDDILDTLKRPEPIYHYSFGKIYDPKSKDPAHIAELAAAYLKDLEPGGLIETELAKHKPDILLYQAGADVHINDPYGGLFTTNEIFERDVRMFNIGRKLGIPIAWNLAGGYQVEPDGNIDKVIEIHMNTFCAAGLNIAWK
jgi:acetoin utilization deacetylase AcuC-like enzyme